MSEPNAAIQKRQKGLIIGAIAGILGLAMAGMFLLDSPEAEQKSEKTKTTAITVPGTVDDKDAWRAQQAAKEKANEMLIGEVNTQLQAQEEKSKKLAQAVEALKLSKSATAEVEPDASILDKPLPVGNISGRSNLQAPTTSIPLNQPLGPVDLPLRREVEVISFSGAEMLKGANGEVSIGTSSSPEVLGFPTEEKAKKYGTHSGNTEDKHQTIEFLPAGSFVRVAMLNGVDAPTGGQAQSNPLPVAFHVLDVANLANKHRLDIKDCRIIAATWGDLSSERMMGRTETLACMINGDSVEMSIKGQVIGEDGKAGVRGRLVTKQGQLLANALFAGALSGIGKAFQSSTMVNSVGSSGVTQTFDPGKIGQAAIGGGVGGAGEQLAQYYLKAADKLYPVIETDGGRTVEILITKGAVYTGNRLANQDYQNMLKRNGKRSRKYTDE